MKKSLAALIIVAIILIIAIAMHKNSNLDQSKETIKIGIIAHQTGFGSVWGEQEAKAAQMRIEELQKENIPVEGVVEDCRSDFKLCTSASQKLISVDNVIAIVGPTWNEWFEVLAPIANQNKTPLIAPSGGNINSYPPYAFSLAVSIEGIARATLDFAKQNKWEKMAVVNLQNEFTNEVTKYQKQYSNEYGLSMVREIKVGNPEAIDFGTEIAQLKQSHPDVVFLNVLSPQYSPFVKKAKELGLNSAIVTLGGSILDENTRPILAGVYELDYGALISPEFRNKFYERYKEEPSPSASMAYDAVSLIGEAIKNGKKTREEVKDYLSQVERYKGYSGNITFTDKNRVDWPPTAYKISQIK